MAEKNQLHVTFRDEDLDSLRRQMLSFAGYQQTTLPGNVLSRVNINT